MEDFDRELLISCSAGLGSWLEDKTGRMVFCKTDDCVGTIHLPKLCFAELLKLLMVCTCRG